MYEHWLHVPRGGRTIVINPAKIVSVAIAYNDKDNVIVSFDGDDNYCSFTKDEWNKRELKREFPNYGNLMSCNEPFLIREDDWKAVKDALTAQQNGCNPCGETMAKVADFLERMSCAGR